MFWHEKVSETHYVLNNVYVVVLLGSLFSLWHWHHPEVCVCVRKHPCLVVCQSGFWQRRLIVGRWIAAPCSPAEAVESDQSEKWQKDINKQRWNKKKRGRQRERGTPETGNTNIKESKRTTAGDEEWKCFVLPPHRSLSVVVAVSAFRCSRATISDQRTPSLLILLIFRFRSANLSQCEAENQ